MNILIKEIETAKQEWINAQQKFEYMTEPEQIDYAIYAIQATQKRYEMLLKQAKRMSLHLLNEMQRGG